MQLVAGTTHLIQVRFYTNSTVRDTFTVLVNTDELRFLHNADSRLVYSKLKEELNVSLHNLRVKRIEIKDTTENTMIRCLNFGNEIMVWSDL
mgnify:CR=1 FL=1